MSENTRFDSSMPGLAPLGRRGFLRASVLAGAALTAGCANMTSRLVGKRDAPEAVVYGSLSEDEVRIVTRLTEVLLPTERYDLPSSIDEIPTVANIDGMVARMSPQTRQLTGLGFWVLEHRPVASLRMRRFTRMNDEQADAYLESLQNGTFVERGLLTQMKALVTVNYWRDSRTWPALDYHGPVTETWGVRRLGNAPQPRPQEGAQQGVTTG